MAWTGILAYLPGGTKKEPEDAPRRRESMERSGSVHRTDGRPRSKGTPGGAPAERRSQNAARRGEDLREGSREPSMESTRRIPPMTTTDRIPAVRDAEHGSAPRVRRTDREGKGERFKGASASHEKKPSLWENEDD